MSTRHQSSRLSKHAECPVNQRELRQQERERETTAGMRRDEERADSDCHSRQSVVTRPMRARSCPRKQVIRRTEKFNALAVRLQPTKRTSKSRNEWIPHELLHGNTQFSKRRLRRCRGKISSPEAAVPESRQQGLDESPGQVTTSEGPRNADSHTKHLQLPDTQDGRQRAPHSQALRNAVTKRARAGVSESRQNEEGPAGNQ